MNFGQLPDGMADYAAQELAEMLARLTTRQRAAIDRIVEHVFINNQPWAGLFRGDDKICREAFYYSRGTVDEETGERSGFGWGHNPDFQEALQHAKRLALETQGRERLRWLQQAKLRAEQEALHAVEVWVHVMNYGKDDFARINAAAKVIELAFRGMEDRGNSRDVSLEQDWWSAAEDDEPRLKRADF